MLKKQEPGVALQMPYIVQRTSDEVVKTSYFMAVVEQPLA